jgi:TldD protein
MSVWGWVLFGWSVPAAANPDVLLQAMNKELERAQAELVLPDQPRPYLVNIAVVEGDVATTTAAFGAITSHDAGPYRTARVEVRVGDHQLDSGNFVGAVGVGDGVVGRGLPEEDVAVALRREVWLALDQAYKGATQQLAAKHAARMAHSRQYPADLVPVDPIIGAPLPKVGVDDDAIKERLVNLFKALAGANMLEESDAIGRDWQGQRLVLSSEGLSTWLRTGHTVFRVAVASRAEDGALVRDARWWVARTPAQLPSMDQMQRQTEEMAAWVAVANAAPIEQDYLGPVLFEAAAAVELFRQILQPQVSGTPPMETAPDPFMAQGAPISTARVGRRLLPAGWSVTDDAAAAPLAAGHYTHDFEGVAPEAITLVQDGVVQRLLMSRVPRADISGSTGHGRSLGNARREAMPAVITVRPKRSRTSAALRRKALAMARTAGLSYVLVVRRLIPPGMSDDFQIAFTGEGPLPGLTTPIEIYRLYPDGREQVVRNVGFVGVDRRVLRDIVAAGRLNAAVDVMDSPGRTGRFSIGAVGGLPATWTVPSVLIDELELRGQGGGESRLVPAPQP